MRALLVIAVVATFVSVNSSAEAQWLRSRRSSSCANGQCGLNSAAAEEATESQPAASEAPSSPAASEVPPAPAADPAPAPAPAAAAPAAPQASQAQTASAGSSRTRSANDAGGGRFWRRLRSRL